MTDAWGSDDKPIEELFAPLVKYLRDNSALDEKYPWKVEMHLARAVRNTLLSEVLCDEFAGYFKDKSLDELDKFAQSFKYENCTQRKKLNEILQADGKRKP